MFAFFSEENTEAILVSQVIQNYVGLSSSLRKCKSKSFTFVGHPIISVILTLRTCDMRRQIMVIPHTFSPSRHNRVRWHAETNYGHSAPFCHLEAASPMTCGDKLWSFRSPFCHLETVMSDGTQRQIIVILCPFVIQRRRAR